MKLIRHLTFCVVSLLLAINANAERAADFRYHAIVFPTKTAEQLCSFSDMDGDALLDLFVIDSTAQNLLVYRQQKKGFGDSPDQTIALPDRTAWIALADVDKHAGLDLLISVPRGLGYFRQEKGRLDLQMQSLINAQQIFASHNTKTALRPVFTLGADATVPVVSDESATIYKRTGASEWSTGEPVPLSLRRTRWQEKRGAWNAGASPSHSVSLTQVFQANAEESPDTTPSDTSAFDGFSEEKTNQRARRMKEEHLDVNGDHRIDQIRWQTSGDMIPNTDIFIFLRNEEDKLPDAPTQVLHCAGLPLPGGTHQRISPFRDLSNDGKCEIVLAALKKTLTSAGSMVDLIVSKGMQWSVSVRTLSGDTFSRAPEASTDVNTILPDETGMKRLFLINGDFNADGRLDLLSRRSPLVWDVFLSGSGREWFTQQPAFNFQIPRNGSVHTQDLNNDGISDFFVQAEDQARIFIFLSQVRGQRVSP